MSSLSASHLVVLQNGLSGHHWRMNSVASYLRGEFAASDCAVVISDVNNMALTYFGIESCGRRLRDYVKQQCVAHPNATRISFVGHSLGGLMIRHCIGLLYEENFFGNDRSKLQMQAALYISIASPHLGVRSVDPLRQALARWAIRQTGAALLLEDSDMLLLRMSEPESSFMLGLQQFQLHAYGNLTGDTLVPFNTACLCDDTTALLYAMDDHACAVAVPAAHVAAAQLVRVVCASASGGRPSDDVICTIRGNLRRLPWNTYAINLQGWLAPHNAICNKGMSQTLGLSRQVVVLDDVARCLAEATAMPRTPCDAAAGAGGCRVM
jgi:hypothetical protein